MHIQAYFSEQDDAESAAISLKALGATQVETGQTEGRDEEAPLSSLLGFSYMGQSGAVLFGAGELGDRESREEGMPMLTAVVPDDLYQDAVKVVRRHGGYVN